MGVYSMQIIHLATYINGLEKYCVEDGQQMCFTKELAEDATIPGLTQLG